MSDIKVKRWVLSRDLNWFTDEMLRMCDGSWFHRAGAEAEKARSPYAVLSSLRGGCSSRIPDDERSERAEVRMVMISWMYCGASPWMALKVVRRILKMILFRTGSQCNWRRTGFMWQRPFTRVTSLAAAFWIRCSLSSSHDGNPKSTELQLSSLEVTNAWTSFSVDAWSRYRRKRPILYRAYDAILHMLLTCWDIIMLLSMNTPRFLADGTGSTLDSPIWSEGNGEWGMWRECRCMISVLLSFSISMLVDIQHLMSTIQRSIAEAIEGCSLGLNVIYNCVSSAYIMQWRLCALTMSSRGSWTW